MRLPFGLLLACPLLAQPSATITVTDALTGQPVADAKITLGPVDFLGHWEARQKLEAKTKKVHNQKLQIATDPSGVARFEVVLPGAYRVSVTCKGYVGAQQRGFQHRQIDVDAASEVKLSIALTPTASLSGTLTGDDNEPLAGATFYAQLEGGNSYYGEVGEGGRFHLEGLEPGRYRIRFSLRTEQVRASLKPRGDEQWGYPVSFFHPGVETVPQAEVVPLTAGIDHRVVLRARRELLASVRGTVLDARTRQPLEGAEVELSLDGVGADEGFDRRRVTAKSAAFDFPFVRPGVAWLLVYRSAQSKLPYVVRLDIGRAGWQGAPIRLPAEVRIEGRLNPTAIKDAKIELRGTRPGAGTVNAAVQADGTFAVDGIPPGPILLSAYSRITTSGCSTSAGVMWR